MLNEMFVVGKVMVINMENKHAKLFKAFRILASICAASCGAFLLLALVTFGPMLFLKENLTIEAGGLIGFFIDIIKEGENPIKSSDLVLSVLPRMVALVLFFVFSLKASATLKRAEKGDFSSAKKNLRSLSVISFLLVLVPSILTSVAQRVVSPFFFNVTETDRTGWMILGLALLLFSCIVPCAGDNNDSAEEQI